MPFVSFACPSTFVLLLFSVSLFTWLFTKDQFHMFIFSGFAENQFNFYKPELGNNVTLVSTSGTHALACDVIPYYTTRQQIVCTTR